MPALPWWWSSGVHVFSNLRARNFHGKVRTLLTVLRFRYLGSEIPQALPFALWEKETVTVRHGLRKSYLDSDSCHQNDNRNVDSAGHSERV